MTVEIFDADLLEPSGLHDTGNADRIVTVAFIDLHLDDSLGMACSIQIIGTPRRLSSVHSHVAVGPLSSPTRTAFGALDRTNAAITSGSEPTTPSRTIDPVSLTTQIEVCFNDTSSPT
jgi:hypothetical protein